MRWLGPFIGVLCWLALGLLLLRQPAHAQSEDWRSHKQQRCAEIAERARALWFDLHVIGYMRENVQDSEYLKDAAAEAPDDRAAYDKVMGDCMGMNM